MSENVENVPSLNITCPYCGNRLYVELEFYGGSYSDAQRVSGFECLESGCGADWDENGILVRKPNWVLFPEMYESPNPDFSEKFTKDS
jgi:hypothetical protein